MQYFCNARELPKMHDKCMILSGLHLGRATKAGHHAQAIYTQKMVRKRI